MRRDSVQRAKYQFGHFELDAQTGELRKNGLRIRLQDQPCQVLLALLESSGQLVTRDQLREQLWSGNTFVEFDHALNTAVKKLRSALSDNACFPRYVETIPRRGYRFIGPVNRVSLDASDVTSPGNAFSQASTATDNKGAVLGSRHTRWAIVATLVTLAVIVWLRAVWTVSSRQPAAAVILAIAPFEDMTDDARGQSICGGLRQDLTAELGRLDPEHLVISAREDLSRASGQSPKLESQPSVDYVLRGSLRRDNSRFRITVQLIRTRDQNYVWAESFDRNLIEPLTSESDLAAEIVGRLKSVLGDRQMASR